MNALRERLLSMTTEELMEEIDILRAALESVEWVPLCPWCLYGELKGHAPDCARQKALNG